MIGESKEEIEYQIERVKKNITDYLSICHKIGLEQRVIDKWIDIHLDDLSNLYKELKIIYK